MRQYFDSLEAEFAKALAVCEQARAKGEDAELKVEIAPASDVAARVEGLVGPKGIAGRIRGLVASGKKREEVCFEIAREILQQKYLPQDEQQERPTQELKEKLIEQAVRSGLALFTEGVVSAPIEGVSKVQLRKNFDDSTYLAVFFSGPIRGAGGTGQAFTLLLADVCRQVFGIENFRPLEDQVERYVEELNLYARKTRAGQYVPKEDEIRHVVRSCAVCIDGEPTEDYEVSKYKNVKDIATNRVRGGVALVVSEGLCLKAAKVLKISKKAGLDWAWIEKLIKVSKNEAEKVEIKPVEKYIDEIVAGRPIFAYPMRPGGFRLRYGRTRFTGIASKAIHPATMAALDDFTAIGTQVKVERPGKGCIMTPCETIEGPTLLLQDGSVVCVQTEAQARELAPRVEKVLFLGDLLVNYGDFSKANHPLVQGAWCEEWYKLLLEKQGVQKTAFEINQMGAEEAIALSREKKVPLAPKYTYFYHDFSSAEIRELCEWLCGGHLLYDWFEFKGFKTKDLSQKSLLERLCIPHTVSGESAVLEKGDALALITTLGLFDSPKDKIMSLKKLEAVYAEGMEPMALVNALAGFPVMKKAGIYVGASMGRPEKAKERKMQPPVHALFPIGEHGGKLRSIPKAIRNLRDKPDGNAMAELEVAHRVCPSCGKPTVGAKCPSCKIRAKIYASCSVCSKPLPEGELKCKCGGSAKEFEKMQIDIAREFKSACDRVSFTPTEIKGVIGMISASHTPEPLEKGVLRAKHGVYVFRDGTCRFDATEVPITHFTPQEIGLSLEKLAELGYTNDHEGNPLTATTQTVELHAQDIILSEYGGDYLVKLAAFVDDELVYLYGLAPYYNAKTRDDLIGKQTIVIAPHTSAGILGRLIGFTKIRGILAHPYLHCATRRNCDGDEDCVILLMDGLLNFSRRFLPETRGGQMDAPLVLTTVLDPKEVDDEVHAMDACYSYPLEFYEACLRNANPGEVKLDRISERLGTPRQYEGIGFTHSCAIAGPVQSKYVQLGDMAEKVAEELALMSRLRPVDVQDAAERIILSHFLPDIYGNLRKFSKQTFRCVGCNAKYRRVPLCGTCRKCGGKLLLTINKGGIQKYVRLSQQLVEKYGLPNYLKQRLMLIEREIDSIFEDEKVKQFSLADYV
jgi:DNA polymerase II large subunit